MRGDVLWSRSDLHAIQLASPNPREDTKGITGYEDRVKVTQSDANGLRLQAPEQFRNGPHANVIYMDNGFPWAEFIFTYKSSGTICRMLFLIIDLLQALGIIPPFAKDVPNLIRPPTPRVKVEPRKRPREEEDHDLREENKRLKVNTVTSRSNNVDSVKPASTSIDGPSGTDLKAP